MTSPKPLRSGFALPALLLLAASLALACGENSADAQGAAASGSPPAPAPSATPAPTPAGNARLVCDQPTFESPSIYEGTVLDHTFTLRVEGEGSLVVDEVKPDCGCTVASVKLVGADGSRRAYVTGTPIAAGTELELVTSLDTRGRVGRQNKPVRILGDMQQGPFTVKLIVDVQAYLVLEPRRLDLGRLMEGDSGAGQMQIRTATGEPMALEQSLYKAVPGLTVDLQPVRPGPDGRAAEWVLYASMGPGSKRGLQSHKVIFESDLVDPNAPALEDGSQPMRGTESWIKSHVIGPVEITPILMSFGRVSRERSTTKTATLLCHDPAFRLQRPEIQFLTSGGKPFEFAAACSVELVPAPERNAWEISLTVTQPAGAPAGEKFRAVLAARVDHPTEREVKVTFNGTWAAE